MVNYNNKFYIWKMIYEIVCSTWIRNVYIFILSGSKVMVFLMLKDGFTFEEIFFVYSYVGAF